MGIYFVKENMKISILILGLIFVPVTLLGQYIYSGIWGSDDYYFDFIPDSNLTQPQNNTVNSMEIDMNGDGSNDIKLSTLFMDGYQWYNKKRITIEGLNQNQIAYSEIDTCWSADFPPIFIYATYTPKELNFNALIDENLYWTDSIVFLSYKEWDAAGPTNNGYFCSRSSQFQSDTGYIAVRLIEPNDTLYGWIKISDVNYASCIIHEFACNVESTNINIIDLYSETNIYPNPSSSGYVIVEGNNQNNQIINIKIYNSVGLLNEYKMVNDNNIRLDLSLLPDGLYLLFIETYSEKKVLKKVVLNKN